KEEIWQQIKVQTINQSAQVVQMNPHRRKWRRAIAVAASIIVVIGLRVLFFNNNKHNNKHNNQSVAVQNDKPIDSSTLYLVHREVNTTGKDETIQLADGSLIVLANKSEVTYRQPFVDRRDITLIGKAWFKVAKDKTRPFAVLSGDISTTALGTEFTVTAFKNDKQVVVRLYEGKVVVKAISKWNKKLKKYVYLLPGQVFVYDGKSKANVKTFELKNTNVPEEVMNEEMELDNPSLPPTTRGSWFMFNNQPLSVVFNELQNMYNVEIIYSKKDISNMYFIGKFVRGDSLERILKKVATLNDLNVIKKNNKYIITK
ncbi:MAG: FecR domain-containing protein, partial [Segetibacter sp.]